LSELPNAKEIRLSKTKPLAPPFHQHIARSKLLGTKCMVGDRIIVYKITATVPEGQVLVTDETIFHFDQA
jgi:hypothetical protein